MLIKSIPLKEGDSITLIIKSTGDKIEYDVPRDYRAVAHFTVDVFPARQKVIFVPPPNVSGSGKVGT